MGKTIDITKSSYTNMLNWLDEDSKIAAEKYRVIRLRMVKILDYRGCLESEELADETIERVAGKTIEVIETYIGNPEKYFFGVMNNVYREYLKKPKLQELPETIIQEAVTTDDEDFQIQYQCLKKCLNKLSAKNKNFILQYYEGEKFHKIQNRKNLADELDANAGVIRVKAFRLRLKLQKCVLKCVAENKNETL